DRADQLAWEHRRLPRSIRHRPGEGAHRELRSQYAVHRRVSGGGRGDRGVGTRARTARGRSAQQGVVTMKKYIALAILVSTATLAHAQDDATGACEQLKTFQM